MHIYFLDTSQFTYTYTYYFSFGSLQIFSKNPIHQFDNLYFTSSGMSIDLKPTDSLDLARNWFQDVFTDSESLSIIGDGRTIWAIPDCSGWKRDNNLSTSMIDVWTYEDEDALVLNLYDRSALDTSPDPVPSASAAAGESPAAQTEGAAISSDLSSQLDVISSSIGSLNLSVALLLFILIFRSVLNFR